MNDKAGASDRWNRVLFAALVAALPLAALAGACDSETTLFNPDQQGGGQAGSAGSAGTSGSGGGLNIDAGNPDPSFDDPDGSRNDMGAYGGPYGSWM